MSQLLSAASRGSGRRKSWGPNGGGEEEEGRGGVGAVLQAVDVATGISADGSSLHRYAESTLDGQGFSKAAHDKALRCVSLAGMGGGHQGCLCTVLLCHNMCLFREDWRMLVNYAMLLPLHFLRSMETASGDKNVYSSAEKAFLATQRKVFNDAVINFLTVRRSMMFVSLVFCVLAFFIEAADVPSAMMTRQAWIHKSRRLAESSRLRSEG